jgi:hypothetical protein
VYFRRLAGKPAPWTSDAIVNRYRFTNAYRAADRVSQFLIREVIYSDRYPNAPAEVVFRILLFKLFNKISTWRLLQDRLGPPTWQSFDPDRYATVLSAALASGSRLYSAAYIMPPVSLDQTGVKHRGHLKLIELMLRGDFVARLHATDDLKALFFLLKEFPSLGDFLAFQLAIDLNYSPLVNHDEGSYVVAGPGARDGIVKTFPDAPPEAAEALIGLMMDRQEAEFERLGITFPSLFGRRLQMIDCQNLFCEISKYTRVSNPEIAGLSGRTRIKQSFAPEGPPAQPWFPPKWGLNESIPIYPTTSQATPRSDLFEARR